ncbi:MAG: hypothetical protein ACXWWR_04450 [Candidatus Limnocylindrales bacterium]
MILRLLLAAFLVAHVAILAGFLSPRPAVTAGAPAWPFDLARSWILTPVGVSADVTRLIGMALFAATLAAFALAAVATLGLLPAGMWPATVAVGAVASLAMLVLFFQPWLVLGVAIDAVLLWAALVIGWSPVDSTPIG